ncbi:hypothetical protein [Fibrobacter intestinalis]|uniref:Major paralogous domain-containing protein n=1 Tax=Fibrobacter intestinalis TaxID=28122 RepID=A0A1T4RTD6_9BACT|nr:MULTISPECIES: hypothetical protein [Fibrobacter]PBC75203.1 hypothetical protein BGW94_2889 [Fibrobacter sp. NR9]SKA19212.1 hypothetical protein SAMN02745108_02836 [Fibrobacter intestinalis]
MGKIRLILAFLFSVAVFSHAEGGCSGPGQNPGIPTQSCYEILSSFYMGIQSADGMFFIDTDKDVQYNNKTYKLRFFVTATSSSYNQIQALAQTGYATRSRIEVIYPNYAETTVTNATALNNTNCSTNTDNAGNAAYMYCPIQALSILE